MNISDYPAISNLMVIRDRILGDLAIVEDASRFHFVPGGIEFWRGSISGDECLMTLKAAGAPRKWADDRLMQEFANDVFRLLQDYLTKDLSYCEQMLTRLGVTFDRGNAGVTEE